MITVYPDQRVSLSKKMKPDWYIDNAKYWINIAKSVNDKVETLKNMNASDGIVDGKTYDYVTAPLKGDDGDFKLPVEIRDIDFITPIKEKNIGEYLELPYDFTVYVNDPHITFKRRADVAKLIEPIVNDVIQQAVEQVKQQDPQQQQQLNPAEIQTKIEDAIMNWVDERVKHADSVIRWSNSVNKFDSVRTQAFFNWWSTEEIYIYLYIANGEFYFDVISPLEGYPILSGKDKVQDGDGFLIKRSLSVNQIYTYYDKYLSKEDRAYLDSILIRDGVTTSDSITVLASVYRDAYGRKMMDSSLNKPYNDNDRVSFSNVNFLDENIIFYVTQVEKKILTSINELGQTVESVVDDNYELNFENGDISIRNEWINEVWKQVLLGNYDSGIYLKPEPIAVQIYNSKGEVKLPVIGRKGLLKGMRINPVPARILPSLALYRIINLHIERTLAKYKAPVELIPQSLLNSTGDAKGTMFYKLADNTIIYDDTKISTSAVKDGYGIIGNSGVSNYLRDLIDLRESLKSEAWDLANMNDARFGQAAPSATVRNNEQNLYRAKLGSVLMINQFHDILADLHTMSVEYGKIVYESGLSGVLLNSKQQPVYFNVPAGALTEAEIGINVVNSVIEKQKLDEFKKLAFSAAQNQDFDIAAEAIDASSSYGVKAAIHKFVEKTREFNLQLERAKGESAIQAANITKDIELAKSENKQKEIELEQQLITDRELKLAEINNNNNKEQ